MEKLKSSSLPPIEKDDSQNIRQLITRFIPYWPVFLILFLLSFSYLYYYLKITVPVFETKASVLIKDEKKGQEDSKMEEVLNVFGTKKIVENELEIFRSNSIVREAVIALHLYAPVFEQKGWRGMIQKPAYETSPIRIEARDPLSVRNTKKIFFTYSDKNKSVTVFGKNYPLDEWSETPWGELRFYPNPNYAGGEEEDLKSVRYYFMLNTVEGTTNGIIGGLLVSASSKQSSIINLSLKDPEPKRAESILSEIVIAYNNSSVERKNRIANQTLQFIDDRLQKVGKELDSIEHSIQSFRDRKGIVDISEQSRSYLQSIGTYDKQLSDLNLQSSALDAVERYVDSKGDKGNIVPSTFNVNDPTLNQLVDKLYNTETQYEKLKNTTGANNPTMKALEEEINKLTPSIKENIQSQRKNIEAGRSYLERTYGRFSSMLNAIPKQERELTDVSRQQRIKSEIYSFLLQKKEETAYSISSIYPDCYVVDKPTTSSGPVSPKKMFLGILAFIVPMGLGFLFISIKEFFNAKILYRSELEKLTEFPVIGELMQGKKLNDPIVTRNAQGNFIVEQFRQIRTALKYQGNPQGNIKRTLITSCIKGDGKSFVSSNLSVSLARSGKKVALLELDLHQPMLSKTLEIPKCNGITDFLSGKASKDEIIVPTFQENLFLVPAGYLADEPSELLVNGKLEVLLTYLDDHFDIIIIDTPPFQALTDAYVIAPHCNLVLNIIRHNHTPKARIQQLTEDMKTHKIHNVAIIFNGVKARGYGKLSYGYGHGYGYDNKSSYEQYNKNIKRKIKKVS